MFVSIKCSDIEKLGMKRTTIAMKPKLNKCIFEITDSTKLNAEIEEEEQRKKRRKLEMEKQMRNEMRSKEENRGEVKKVKQE